MRLRDLCYKTLRFNSSGVLDLHLKLEFATVKDARWAQLQQQPQPQRLQLKEQPLKGEGQSRDETESIVSLVAVFSQRTLRIAARSMPVLQVREKFAKLEKFAFGIPIWNLLLNVLPSESVILPEFF